MSTELSEAEKLKIIYQEIIEGASHVPSKNYYVKHFTEMDSVKILRKRIEIFESYVSQGVPNEETKLKEVIANEEWSAKQEDDILSLRYIISDNEKNVNTLIPEQAPMIRNIIKQKKEELFALIMKRREVLGMTAEEASEKDVFYFTTYMSLFKDLGCTVPYFESIQNFEEIDEEKLQEHVEIVGKVLARFNEQSIKHIAALPFFLNNFSYAKEAIYTFLNKPLIQMTNYQMLLFSMGSRNINILSQSAGEPPELLGDITVQQVVDWYDQQYSVILGRRNSGK